MNGLERERIIFKWNGEKNDEVDVVAVNKKIVINKLIMKIFLINNNNSS